VLVVEPNRKTRSIIQTVLGREGFRVVATSTADEGLRQIDSESLPPELVVAEAKLDGADGFSLCSRLRADERTAQVPIILMSRASGVQQEELATQAGADDFVAKPTFARDLVSLVQLRAGSSFGETNFRENTAELPLPILLRALLAGVRSGRIELFDPAAQVMFRHGGVVECYFGRTRGAEALVPALLLGDGEYSVSFSRTLVRGSFYLSLKELYSTVLPAVRRWQRFADGASLSARLVVDFVAFRSSLSEIPESAHEVIRLFDGHRTVRQCVLECMLTESTALAVIWRLYKMGVLEKPTAQAAVPRATSRGRGSFLESKERAKSDEAGESSRYENLHQFLMLEETPRIGASSPFRSALQIGLAAVAIVGIAAGAGWVVSRGDVPRFLNHRPSGAGAQSESAAKSGSPQLAPAQSTPRPDLQDAIGLLESGQKGEAVQLLTRAVQSAPTTGNWFLLGIAKFESGDTDGARQAALQVLQLNPRHGRARMLLAAIYLDQKQTALASAELQRYLEQEPNGPYAAQARQLLSSH
jgi:CheY-like chemotaxis protein